MGRCGVCSGLTRLPVTAQVMTVLWAKGSGSGIMLSEVAATVDDEARAGDETKGGGEGLDGGGDVIGLADALERRALRRLGVEIGAASGHETRFDDAGRNRDNADRRRERAGQRIAHRVERRF